MSNELFLNIGRFLLLVLLQVLVLNHINFLGYINPYFYILFILALPVNLPSMQVIFIGFLLGLTVDAFGDTGGMHAAACTVIAYLRPRLQRASYGLSYDYQTVKFGETDFNSLFLYVASMVFIHHLVLFFLVYFNFAHTLLILKNTLFSGLFTILLILMTTSLFQKGKR